MHLAHFLGLRNQIGPHQTLTLVPHLQPFVHRQIVYLQTLHLLGEPQTTLSFHLLIPLLLLILPIVVELVLGMISSIVFETLIGNTRAKTSAIQPLLQIPFVNLHLVSFDPVPHHRPPHRFLRLPPLPPVGLLPLPLGFIHQPAAEGLLLGRSLEAKSNLHRIAIIPIHSLFLYLPGMFVESVSGVWSLMDLRLCL